MIKRAQGLADQASGLRSRGRGDEARVDAWKAVAEWNRFRGELALPQIADEKLVATIAEMQMRDTEDRARLARAEKPDRFVPAGKTGSLFDREKYAWSIEQHEVLKELIQLDLNAYHASLMQSGRASHMRVARALSGSSECAVQALSEFKDGRSGRAQQNAWMAVDRWNEFRKQMSLAAVTDEQVIGTLAKMQLEDKADRARIGRGEKAADARTTEIRAFFAKAGDVEKEIRAVYTRTNGRRFDMAERRRAAEKIKSRIAELENSKIPERARDFWHLWKGSMDDKAEGLQWRTNTPYHRGYASRSYRRIVSAGHERDSLLRRLEKEHEAQEPEKR